MSLAERLKQAKPRLGPSECHTCAWLQTQTPKDRAAFDDWIANGNSQAQLRRECQIDGLNVSETSFGRHVRNCMKKQA